MGLLNGALWGGLMGLATLLLYRTPSLGLVMAAAVVLNLVVAAVMGVAVPLLLRRAGGTRPRAPACCSRSSRTAWGS